MYSQEMLEKYADVLLEKGVNIQPGQYLLLQCCPDTLALAEIVCEKALQKGAKDVHVSIADPKVNHLRAKYLSEEQCSVVLDWQKEELDSYLREDCVQLGLMGTYPTLYNDVSDDNAMAIAKAGNEIRNVVRKYIHDGSLQWTGTAYPTKEWANQVYPELDEEDALKQLEEDIAHMMRLDTEDPLLAWDEHCSRLRTIGNKLNAYQFEKLHLTSELGTDLMVGLVENHIWCSAADMGSTNVRAKYIANMPTEEIFTDPHCDKVNGIAYASKPLIINGKLVKDFWIKFEDGRAIDCGASENVEFLKSALYRDERTRRLGEVALVSKQSPINQMQRLFYNGLIDENAASHLAFGSSFPTNVKDGIKMSEDELIQHGVNVACSHNDFMVGTEHYHVEGITKDGEVVVIMDDGDFVI
jgi:aminopeptidase